MDYENLIDLRISQSPLFCSLPDEDLKKIKSQLIIRKYQKSETIALNGDFSEYFVLILSGSIEISRINFDGIKSIHRRLYSPASVGYCLLAGKAHSADISAETSTVAALIPVTIVKQVLLKNPQQLFTAVNDLSSLVETLSSELLERKSDSLETRVLNAVKRNSDKFGKLKISHEELSLMVGAERSNVSRTLKLLENKNLLKLERRQISLCDIKPESSADL